MGYNCFYGARVLERETEEDGGAVVEDVGGVGFYVEGGEEGGDGAGEGGECEGVVGRGGCETVAGEGGGEDVVVWGEEGEEDAVLVRGGGEAVEEEEGGEGGGAGGCVGDGDAGGEREEVVGWGVGHFLAGGEGWWLGEHCGEWGEVDEVATRLGGGVEFLWHGWGGIRAGSKLLPNHQSAVVGDARVT